MDSIAIPVVGGRPRSTPTVSAPSVAVPRPSPVATPTSVPVQDLPVWDGKDRVTILLLGIDMRSSDPVAPTRSDTMILLTLDPLSLTAGMFSIPRDLWVPIPGYAENKINVAHFLGEARRAGEGPELARRTVQLNLGVPVHYTARVDFKGFERLIDTIGGVTVDVERAILDSEYPNENYGINRVYIGVGPQRMDGITALRYARSRHSESDFGRTRRQQRVLEAARMQTLNLGLVPKLPQMIGILTSSITMDVPVFDLLALANLGRQIPREAIITRQVDHNHVIDVNGDGTVLVPDRAKIRPIIQEVFYDPVVRANAATIEILNGTSRDGIATAARTALVAQRFDVRRVDSAGNATFDHTQILVRDGTKRETGLRLARALGVPAASVISDNRQGAYHITVILGGDFTSVR